VNTEFRRGGIRYRLATTTGSRWGTGKVHLQHWLRDQKIWHVVCRDDRGAGIDAYNTSALGIVRPVTCKKCKAAYDRLRK
jgi:hypothetical protein